MNAFQKLTQDIFNIPQFRDVFYVTEQVYTPTSTSSNSSSTLRAITCIDYHSENDAVFTQFGVDQGFDMQMVVKCADFTPKKNQKITFHNKQYKIVSWTTDGYDLMNNIKIKSLTSK